MADPSLSTGVYKWTNLVNGKVYIGSAARSFEVRLSHYKSRFKVGKCHNTHLQRAWDKYGSHNLVFSVVERCLPINCEGREAFWIAYYDATNPECGYNQCM